MTPAQELVWKLIDQSITDEQFDQLQDLLEADPALRSYYQDCLETKEILRSISSSQQQRSRVLVEASKRALFLGRQHFVTGLAGLLCGVLGTTLVHSAVTSKGESPPVRAIPLITDPFEDPTQPTRYGFPEEKGVWHHQRQNSIATDYAIRGNHVLKMVAEEGQPLSLAYYLIDLEDFSTLGGFSSLKVQASGNFRSDIGEPKAHYSIRLAAFAEAPKEIAPIWGDESQLFTRKLSHVGRSCFKNENSQDWTDLSAEMEIPEGARTLVIGFGAGSGDRDGGFSTHFLDDIAVGIILQNKK